MNPLGRQPGKPGQFPGDYLAAFPEEGLQLLEQGIDGLIVAHTHPMRATVQVSLDSPDRVRFDVDAGAWHQDRAGYVTLFLCTPQAEAIISAVAAAR